MASNKAVFAFLVWFSSVFFTSASPSPFGIFIPDQLALDENLIDEEDSLHQIRFWVETDAAPTDGDIYVEYVLDDITNYYDVEPGRDFTPDVGEFPSTVTMTIPEGELTSNTFILQVIDDCHQERNEGFQIFPARGITFSEGGTQYDVRDQSSTFVFEESIGEYQDSSPVLIGFNPEHEDIGLVFFEGELNPFVPVAAFETCGTPNRIVPIDATCGANLVELETRSLVTPTYSFNVLQSLEPGDDGFTFTITDVDGDFNPDTLITIDFAEEECCPPVFNHALFSSSVTIRIIDNDMDDFYGVVHPAVIDRQDTTDVNVYAITTTPEVDTSIHGNTDVCPHDASLPLVYCTPLVCKRNDQSYGQRIKFPKPKRHSRDRFGSYVISADYGEDGLHRIPVFILPTSDALQPLTGPTITINNGEDVVLGVRFSQHTDELRWKFNGKPLKQYSRKCNFEIKNAKYGKDDGYYEVYRIQRGDSGYRIVIRLIIRPCPEGQFIGSSGGCHGGCFCLNGGVCGNEFPDNLWRCVCPIGFYGRVCQNVYPDNLRIGPPEKGITCKGLGKDVARDCRGALFCFKDPLGCLCARGYWGQKCDNVCPPGRFGWSCLQRCRCAGSWIPCDPKTGICQGGACADNYEGENCQFRKAD